MIGEFSMMQRFITWQLLNYIVDYTLTVTASGNYTGSVTKMWGIGKAVSVITTAPKANTLTYSGEAQALVTAGTSSDGKVVYSLSENGQYTESIPTGLGAGDYTVWYYVKGDDNHSDSAKTSVTVDIFRKPATFSVKDNVVEKGQNVNPAITSDPANVAYEMIYRKDGNQVTPEAVGEYEIYVKITDSNYRHATTTDGSSVKIGLLSIYEKEVPKTYTLSYAAGNGTGTMAAEDAALSGTVRILPDNSFTAPVDENGYPMLFAGWSDGTAVYQPGEKYVQPEKDVTLTARWEVEEHDIGGMVKQYIDMDSDALVSRSGVTITLMLGSRKITQAITDNNGNYEFEDCLQGTYNLVAELNGIKKTVKVVLGHSDQTALEIKLPAVKTNTAVSVQPGTPAVVVGGLDDMKTDKQNSVITEAEKTIVAEGGEVEIKMDVKENPTPAKKTEIDNAVK